MNMNEKKLTFKGSVTLSLIPVAIYVFFCIVLFIGFRAFNMEALAVGGFLALLIGGFFATSYSAFWDSAIRGISSITSVSVVVILLLVGMFSQLVKLCGLSSGFVWLANRIGMQGGAFVAFTFIATCVVSTATGSSIPPHDRKPPHGQSAGGATVKLAALNLPIARKWFDMIASGKKREEYRDVDNAQCCRLFNKAGRNRCILPDGIAAIFRNGYRPDSPALVVTIEGLTMRGRG